MSNIEPIAKGREIAKAKGALARITTMWLRDNEPRSWGKVGLTQVNPTDQPRDDAAD
jgi:hypothetical protein